MKAIEGTERVRKVCPNCGSENVTVDAHASWNVEKQDWELGEVFAETALCNECDESYFNPRYEEVTK